MGMSLTAVKAKHGDALILRHGDTNVLIDGGAKTVWRKFLAKQIVALDPDASDLDPPVLDLLVVSHIDSDHIAGILDLTDAILEAKDEQKRPPVTISRAWVNTFSDAILEAGVDDGDAPAAATSLASTLEELGIPVGDVAAEHTALMLSSVRQGRDLRKNLGTLSVPVNERFAGGLALGGDPAGPWQSGGGLSIRVIGPTQKEIDELREEWEKQLPKILAKEAEKRARTEAMAQLDRSVYNLASIVMIAEADGKSILFTGDARGDMILEWLDASPARAETYDFDVLKIPHHGSDANVRSEFFRRIKARTYLISGDGHHGNPEPAVLEMIFESRGKADEYEICLTYSPEEIKTHKKFSAESAARLDEILDADPSRRKRLVFPAAGATAIAIAL